MAEWSMAPVLKTGVARATVGSNPTPSVEFLHLSFGLIAAYVLSRSLRLGVHDYRSLRRGLRAETKILRAE
jgi:hypothetical protein